VTERQAENCTPYNLETGWLVKVLFTNSVLAATFLYKFDGQFAVSSVLMELLFGLQVYYGKNYSIVVK
jgi:hypothetical protein